MNIKEINRISESIISTLKLAANGDPKKEKQVALTENIMQFAAGLTEVALLAAPNRKRILKPINRTPGRRMQRKKKLFTKLMELRMLEMRRLMILSAPIPKYPLGSYSPAIIGETGPELIMNKDGKIIKV